MDDYDLQSAVRPFVHFLDDLTKWYIRRSRRRFWKSQDDGDKRQAYATLYEVLLRLGRIAAPFTPFIAEAIHRNLRTDDLPESVHLCDFPRAEPGRRDLALEAQMDEAIRVVELGRQVRTQFDLKVRQPLRRLVVVCHDQRRLELIGALRDVIADELNVREVALSAKESELATLTAKPDLKKLGPRLGARLRPAGERIRTLPPAEIEALLGGGTVVLALEGGDVTLSRDDVLIERKAREGMAVAAAGDLVVALDTELDEGLIRDGLAREFVNKIQSLRKAADLDLAQRIELAFDGDDEMAAAVAANVEYICAETLALSCVRKAGLQGEEIDLNGRAGRVQVTPLPPGVR